MEFTATVHQSLSLPLMTLVSEVAGSDMTMSVRYEGGPRTFASSSSPPCYFLHGAVVEVDGTLFPRPFSPRPSKRDPAWDEGVLLGPLSKP